MVTKALIRSINSQGNRCVVRMPLFETAASSAPVEAEALVSIPPGMFQGLEAGDVVFVAFEENALEKPIIIGKLFTKAGNEQNIRGGSGILDTLTVRTHATIPATSLFKYPDATRNDYKNLETPKKVADYIKWLERYAKNLIKQLYEHFTCFKKWTQWQLRPENVEVDDGDLDTGEHITEPYLYQCENENCEICGRSCPKNKTRQYLKVDTEKNYPKL